MRIVLYTGKGGVGKTSVAAATALRAAEMGHRTVVLSTDAAHSLGDSLDVSLSNEPKLVAPNLWAQEIEMSATVSKYWATIQEWMSALLAWRGMEQIVADEMAVLPGMEELASLLYVIHHYDKGNRDLIVADMAPTGETLRLLSFPD
ncbi:MAG: ArsA family ATPase, partial [Chloroflexota bacterium]